MNVRIRPVPTGSPRSRRFLPRPTRGWTGPLAILPDHLAEVRRYQRLVLVILHDGAERVGRDRRFEPLRTEEGERVRPVDRLGDARHLREVELPEPFDGHRDVARERLADVRRTRP